MNVLVDRIATALAHRAVLPGDRVVAQVEKSPEAIALYLACLRIGAVFVPLNTAYTAAEIDYFLGDADPQEARATAEAVHLPGCAFAIEQARYWKHNRIVWAGPLETPPELGQLAQALGESRRYAAHVTLIRKARAPRHLPPVPALGWPVPEFVLVGSTLSAEGPSYEVLGRYALR